MKEKERVALQLSKITKTYGQGDTAVEALKSIDIIFRKSEFVSILGPSGCGKTTTLNIIGGLDGYTSGDLIIGGKSTKDFKDRDWDAYRNHSIGFVFQSYNLIPHQSVLQNVELALSLSGVSKKERKKRAVEALEMVGLKDQIKKKPSEMSGGQMQRVAIARAIVNNPDIILADEPSGALDTETSIQIMDILKEISKDRLVIMVTHNPELAEHYSTRIIRMLDGVITSDTNPVDKDAIEEDVSESAESQIVTNGNKVKKTKKARKPSMSFSTSFVLSLKNLFTKKGRTILTSFAGSIGIIGIALVVAVSQGMTNYINLVQEETLSSYPLTIEKQHMDTSSLFSMFLGKAESDDVHENDAVYKKEFIYKLVNAISGTEKTENDLESFKKYLESEIANENSDTGLDKAVAGIQYSYNLNPLIYTKNVDGTIMRSDANELMTDIMKEYLGIDMSGADSMNMGALGNVSMTQIGVWQEMLPGKNGSLISPLIQNQYDLVYGSWPNQYNEIILVVDEHNELDDMTLYTLGLTSKSDMDKLVDAALNGKEIQPNPLKWSYEEICDMDFRTILGSSCYQYDASSGTYVDIRQTESGLKYLYDNATKLKVTGIIKPKADALSPMLSGSICYTTKFTEYIVNEASKSPVVTAQQNSPTVDIFTGLPFKENSENLTDEQKQVEFKKYIQSLDDKGKANVYVKIKSTPTQEQIDGAVSQTVGLMTRAQMEEQLVKAISSQAGMSEDVIKEYVSSMSDDEIKEIFSQLYAEQYKLQYAQTVTNNLMSVPTEQLVANLESEMESYTKEQYALYYDEILEFSTSTYENNLSTLGAVDLDSPIAINIYASSFEDKDVIKNVIAKYNDKVDEEFQKIAYTDYVGLLMDSVTTIIDAITYVLIAFVAVSLIVSSIMIGVITLISVQERTKEIGILRAIGASKRNVSSMFNAETLIIGFASGLLGVVITYLLCIPINLILQALTGIGNLSATLPITIALLLVGISMLLTLIAGIIPSRSAAKKDPVVALRSE